MLAGDGPKVVGNSTSSRAAGPTAASMRRQRITDLSLITQVKAANASVPLPARRAPQRTPRGRHRVTERPSTTRPDSRRAGHPWPCRAVPGTPPYEQTFACSGGWSSARVHDQIVPGTIGRTRCCAIGGVPLEAVGGMPYVASMERPSAARTQGCQSRRPFGAKDGKGVRSEPKARNARLGVQTRRWWKGRQLRRIPLAFAGLVLVIGLYGCGGSGGTNSQATITTQPCHDQHVGSKLYHYQMVQGQCLLADSLPSVTDAPDNPTTTTTGCFYGTHLEGATCVENPTSSTQPPMVEYKVTGGNVNITYADPSDDTIQQVTVHGPWSKSWPDTGSDTFLSISVQNEVGNSGQNSCTITVDGGVVSTHSASGYNIADCKR